MGERKLRYKLIQNENDSINTHGIHVASNHWKLDLDKTLLQINQVQCAE